MFSFARRNRLLAACSLLCVSGIFALYVSAQDTKPTIQADLIPRVLTLNTQATLIVTVSIPTATQDGTLQVSAPPGFSVTPGSYQLGSAPGVKTRQFEIQTPRTYVPAATWKFVIVLSDRSGDLASVSYPFGYGAGISLSWYFVFGAAGIAMGYAARLVIDSLNSLPKPVISAAAVSPGGGTTPDLGRFTDFIKHHYYLMDFLVTLVLGFLALVALVKDNHAPDTGLYWYSASALGFGVGLLTNSDLITRLRTR